MTTWPSRAWQWLNNAVWRLTHGPDPVIVFPAGQESPRVCLSTTLGDIHLELNGAQAPITVTNFLAYVDAGFYDGTLFHRVIPGFMIQGGGLTSELRKKGPLRPAIRNEANNGLRNMRGTIAMARTNRVHSAQAQFFINLLGNSSLDHKPNDFGYAVFGQVIGDGMKVVDQIAKVATGSQGIYENIPRQPVVIQSAKRL
ncbi:MAG: peptidyl-prolyl cis-trans isomerase [Magnetococcales bacterium]|nr:peptidyl-prolyl cis-trans isomerase [Magnetococcales bacterium]